MVLLVAKPGFVNHEAHLEAVETPTLKWELQKPG